MIYRDNHAMYVLGETIPIISCHHKIEYRAMFKEEKIHFLIKKTELSFFIVYKLIKIY
jgi:hypothetical protein